MHQTKLAILVGMTATLIAACSSSKSASDSSTPPTGGVTSAPATSAIAPASTPASVAASSTAPATSVAAERGLSGTWQGRYGGSYTGTFVLRWTQAASKLTGTITLSTAPEPLAINGTVSGGRIQFGTVGSQAITYTGTVSGTSMHGRYEIAGGAGGSGTWSARRR